MRKSNKLRSQKKTKKEQPQSERLDTQFEQYTLTPNEEQTPVDPENIAATESDEVPESQVDTVFWHSKKGGLWVSLFGLLIVASVAAGLFILKEGLAQSDGKTQNTSVTTPIAGTTTAPLPSNTPTPKAPDRSAYKIEVLNGSGTEGAAAKAKEELEKAGFTVASVGNADKNDYSLTIIKSKKEVSVEYIDTLKKRLSLSYSLGDQSTLTDANTADVVVIIGRK
jgi:hypothetical protein